MLTTASTSLQAPPAAHSGARRGPAALPLTIVSDAFRRLRMLVACGYDGQHRATATETAQVVGRTVAAAGYHLELVDVRDVARALSELPGFVIPCVHDVGLDDGSLQDYLDLLGAQYAGSPGPAVRLCADKGVTSAALASAGLAVPPHRVVSNGAIGRLDVATALRDVTRDLGPDHIVKPTRGSGAYGVHLVRDGGDTPSAVISALSYDEAVVVERYQPGTEVSVLVCGDADRPVVVGSAVVENPRLHDPRSTQWDRSFEPSVSFSGAIDLTAAMTAASDAFAVLGLRGYATVDIIIDGATAWVFDVDCELDLSTTGKTIACLRAAGLTMAEFVTTYVVRSDDAPQAVPA